MYESRENSVTPVNAKCHIERIAYRVTELSAMLGLPKSTLHDMIRRGDLRAFRSGRVLLVFKEDLDAWGADIRKECQVSEEL